MVTLIPPQDLEALFSEFSEAEAKFRWSYDYPTQIMTVHQGPSFVRETMASLLAKIEHAASDLLYKNSAKIELHPSGNPLITLFPDDPSKTFKKCADGGISVLENIGEDDDCIMPALVIEVGFSQSYKELNSLAKKWLLGSGGKVRTVLLVEFKQPSTKTDFGDVTKWSGYIETWVRNTSNVGTNGPPDSEAQSSNAEHRYIIQKGNRFYFLNSGTTIPPNVVNFKIDITDIVDPTMLPVIPDPTLVIGFEKILNYVKRAILVMVNGRKKEALKIVDDASTNINANADPNQPYVAAAVGPAVDPGISTDVDTAATTDNDADTDAAVYTTRALYKKA